MYPRAHTKNVIPVKVGIRANFRKSSANDAPRQCRTAKPNAC